jgi:hypothetical protein
MILRKEASGPSETSVTTNRTTIYTFTEVITSKVAI